MNPKKKFRNRILNRIKLERTYKPSYLAENPHFLFNDYFKMAVLSLLAKNGKFRFIQIGAFNGVDNDPLHLLIKTYNLEGILVEPQAEAFSELKSNYNKQHQLIFENCAISSKDEKRKFYTSKKGDTQVASFDKTHLIKRKINDADILEIEIDCLTIRSVLKKHNYDNVDLIQIDTEGADYEILKSINFGDIKPSIVRFEHEHLSSKNFNASIELLASHGFKFIVERRDVLAIKIDINAGV